MILSEPMHRKGATYVHRVGRTNTPENASWADMRIDKPCGMRTGMIGPSAR